MKRFAAVSCMILAPVFLSVLTLAQQEQSASAPAPVPHIVQYAGVVAGGASDPIAIKFALYAAETGGDPLWSETQTISPDGKGRYSVLLGSATQDGLPQLVFSNADAKWLGVTVGDAPESARTILVASPYALKSSDAETLGGHPVSDFLLSGGHAKAEPPSGTDITQIDGSNGVVVNGSGTGPTVTLGLSSSYLESLGNEIYPQLGATNTLTGKNIFSAGKLFIGNSPVLSAANILASSPVSVTASGSNVTIGLSDSALVTLGNSVYAQLGAANTFSKPITFASGQSFPGTVSLGANNMFTGNDTFSKAIAFASGQTFPGTVSLSGNNAFTGTNSFSNPVAFASSQSFPGTISLSANNAFTGSDSFSKAITFASGQSFPGTVLLGGNNSFTGSNSFSAPITFASGQTFPGTGNGTITGVTAGTGLSGGGTSGSVALSLNTTYLNTNYAGLNSSDTFTSPLTLTSTETINGAGNIQLNVTTSNTSGVAIHAQSGGTSGMGIYSVGNIGVVGSGAIGLQSFTTSQSGVGVQANGGPIVGGYGVDAAAFTAVHAAGSTTGFASTLAGDGTGVAASGFIGVLATGGTNSQVNYLAGTGVYATGYNAVVAEASGSTGFGVYASGATAVEAVSSATSGTAVVANASGTYSQGVAGMSADSTYGVGIFGFLANKVSDTGMEYPFGAGLWGDAGPGSDASGVLGTGDNNSAGYFQNESDGFPTLYAGNFSTTTGSTIALFNDGSGDYCKIYYGGNIFCNGSVQVVPKRDDGRSIEMYSPQATENWFEDYGGGHLTNGSATVALDSTYAAMVNTGVEYRVFLTPNGDCKGLYVASKGADSFEVHELGGGRANLSFDYKIVAKRKGMEDVRMRDVTEQQTRQAAMDEARRKHRARPVAQRAEVRGPLAR